VIQARRSVTNITGLPQGCAPALQILHPAEAGFRMTPVLRGPCIVSNPWLLDGVILNGLQAVKDLAWVGVEPS
jgi:hypothetical protein